MKLDSVSSSDLVPLEGGGLDSVFFPHGGVWRRDPAYMSLEQRRD